MPPSSNPFERHGLPENATDSEIKAAKNELLTTFHPDKHPDATPAQRRHFERETQQILEDFSLLEDSAKRQALLARLEADREASKARAREDAAREAERQQRAREAASDAARQARVRDAFNTGAGTSAPPPPPPPTTQTSPTPQPSPTPPAPATPAAARSRQGSAWITRLAVGIGILGGGALIALAVNAPGANDVIVDGDANEFKDTLYKTTSGTQTFSLVNGSDRVHDLAIRDESGRVLARTPRISDGSADVTITVQDMKDYLFYCTVPGHRQQGMVGHIIAVD